MPGNPQSNLKDVLDAVTTRSLLKPVPVLAVTVLSTLVHLITSVDLGFGDLLVRTLVAVVSVIPLFICILLAHRLSFNKKGLIYIFVPLSYLIGGSLRGALLETLLIATSVLEEDFTSYRIYAGVLIITTTCSIMAFAWAMAERAGNIVINLQNETQDLETALQELRSKSIDFDNEDVVRIKEVIEKELIKVADIESTELQDNLKALVDEMVKPLSVDFSKEIKEWKSPKFDSSKLTFAGFWKLIDPINQLPTPIVSLIALVTSSIASVFTFLDLRTALELILGVSIAAFISTKIAYLIIRRWYKELKGIKRDFSITLIFFLIAVPPAYVQTLVLADTDDPRIYVAATLLIAPLFGWLIVIGSAALGLQREVRSELLKIRDDLKWVVSRINLLSWYRRGVISRLLHGPIQNSIQVALLRLKSADEDQSEAIVREVIARIDNSIQAVLNPSISIRDEMLSLNSIQEVWGSVASISLDFDEVSKTALEQDVATFTIVTDLIHEICSNSIRHGQARQLSIRLRADMGVVDITVTDDGNFVGEIDSSSGLGAKFLEACSMSWSRTRVTNQNILNLQVPTTFGSPITV